MRSAAAPRPGRRASLGAVFGVVLLDLLGFGIVIPQLGIHAAKFDAPPWAVGLLLSSYSLMQLVFAPVLGRWSDRFGRRPVLLLSIGGSLLGFLLFAFAGSLPLLFLSRIIDGISGGNIATAQAYVADVTREEDRAKGMGLLGAAFGLGFILGPAVGGFLGALGGNLAIGLAAAGLAAVNWVLVFLFLPESRHPGSAAVPDRSLSRAFAAFRIPGVALVLLAFAVFVTAFAQMEGTFSMFFLVRFLGANLEVGGSLLLRSLEVSDALAKEASIQVGWLFVAIGLVSAVIQGGLIGRLRARFGEKRLAVAGATLTLLGLAGMPLVHRYAWFFVPICLLAAGSALVNPSLSSLVSLRAPAERQGEVLGAFQAMGSVGRVLGPAMGGLWFAGAGEAAGFVSGAVLMGVAVVLCARIPPLRLAIAR